MCLGKGVTRRWKIDTFTQLPSHLRATIAASCQNANAVVPSALSPLHALLPCGPPGGTGGQPSVLSLVLEPRSLLVFQGDAYEGCLHGIEDVSHFWSSFGYCNRWP